MVSDTINAVLAAEKNADLIKSQTKSKVELSLKKARAEADAIVASKVKEANKNAELRVNIARENAKKYTRQVMELTQQETKGLVDAASQNKEEAINLILSLVV